VRIKKEHWLIWLAAKTCRVCTAEQLLSALFTADRKFRRKYGEKLTDFVYTAWLNGLYSYEFYEVLEEAADAGLIEYVVSVKLPEAPGCGGDEDCRLAAVQHEMSRVDAEGEYVRRTVKPLVDGIEPPQDLLRLLEGVNATLDDLVAIVKSVASSRLKSALEGVGQHVE